MTKQKYPCVMSDHMFGTREYGFISRKDDECSDDEDLRYQRFVQKQLPPGQRARCVGGILYILSGEST